MTNPTDHENDRPRWWLDLDDGEQLLVMDVPDGGWETYDPRGSVVLKMPALRAYDLSRVLDLYSRLMALFYESGQVSATEHALSSALRDAGRTLEGRDRDAHRPEPHRVTSAARLRAMAVLQANRPVAGSPIPDWCGRRGGPVDRRAGGRPGAGGAGRGRR